eukprot:6738716-Prymnesium_polylepis.2
MPQKTVQRGKGKGSDSPCRARKRIVGVCHAWQDGQWPCQGVFVAVHEKPAAERCRLPQQARCISHPAALRQKNGLARRCIVVGQESAIQELHVAISHIQRTAGNGRTIILKEGALDAGVASVHAKASTLDGLVAPNAAVDQRQASIGHRYSTALSTLDCGALYAHDASMHLQEGRVSLATLGLSLKEAASCARRRLPERGVDHFELSIIHLHRA